MATGLTKMEQMLDPEVLADMIDAEIGKAIRFAPLAEVDTTCKPTRYNFDRAKMGLHWRCGRGS
nr:hypothetical protein [Streptococcus suis]